MNAVPKTADPIQLKPKAGEAPMTKKTMKRLKGFAQDALKKLTGVDSKFDLKIQELAEKAERGIPVESEVKELIEEAKKNPKLQELVQDDQKKPILKKRLIGSIIFGGALALLPSLLD